MKAMLNLISILFGVAGFGLAMVGFIPLFGWLNWFAIPFAIIGLAIGLFSRHRSGRNLNVLVILFGGVRLFLGGGIL